MSGGGGGWDPCPPSKKIKKNLWVVRSGKQSCFLVQKSSYTASKRNEYQEYFLGGKSGRCVWLTTLPPSGADCLEI
jgi:hypothetical protein